jgi:hypothetical protein
VASSGTQGIIILSSATLIVFFNMPMMGL